MQHSIPSVGMILQQEPEQFFNLVRGRRWADPSYQFADFGSGHCTIETAVCRLNQSELRDVLLDLDLLLTRATQSVLRLLVDPLIGYLKLLQEVCCSAEEELTRKLLSDKSLFHNFMRLLQELLFDGAKRRQLALAVSDAVEVLAFLADSSSLELKDRVGALLTEPIMNLVAFYMNSATDTEQSSDPLQVGHPLFAGEGIRFRRCLMSVLVNLVKKSKANKELLLPYARLFGQILPLSSDFLLQMQTIELIYRVFKHKKGFLTETELPSSWLKEIEALPNDRTLLKQIIDSINRQSVGPSVPAANNSLPRKELVKFDAAEVRIGGEHICGTYTTVYFSRSALFVLLPEMSGENVTIPFSEIRTVTLNKNRTVTFSLRRIPLKLVELHSSAVESAQGSGSNQADEFGRRVVDHQVIQQLEKEPNLKILFTPQSQEELRQSSVNAWILEAKRRQQQFLQRNQQQDSAPAEDAVMVPDAAPPAPAQVQQGRQPEKYSSGGEGTTSRNDIAVDAFSATAFQHLAAANRRAPTKPTEVVEKEPNTSNGTGRKRSRETATGSTARGKVDDGTSSRHDGLSKLDATTSGSGTYSQPSEDVFEQLRRTIQGKVARVRVDNSACLQDAFVAIQREVDQLKNENRKTRDSFEMEVKQSIRELQAEETLLKQRQDSVVADLNSGLQELQSVAAVIQTAIDELEEDDPDAFTREVEEAELIKLKSRVEGELRSMEQLLNNFLSSAIPLRFLTAYLHKKAEE